MNDPCHQILMPSFFRIQKYGEERLKRSALKLRKPEK